MLIHMYGIIMLRVDVGCGFMDDAPKTAIRYRVSASSHKLKVKGEVLLRVGDTVWRMCRGGFGTILLRD